MLAGATVVDVVHGAKIGRFEPKIGVTDKSFARAANGGATMKTIKRTEAKKWVVFDFFRVRAGFLRCRVTADWPLGGV